MQTNFACFISTIEMAQYTRHYAHCVHRTAVNNAMLETLTVSMNDGLMS